VPGAELAFLAEKLKEFDFSAVIEWINRQNCANPVAHGQSPGINVQVTFGWLSANPVARFTSVFASSRNRYFSDSYSKPLDCDGFQQTR
jgi:hypothetical protein